MELGSCVLMGITTAAEIATKPRKITAENAIFSKAMIIMIPKTTIMKLGAVNVQSNSEISS